MSVSWSTSYDRGSLGDQKDEDAIDAGNLPKDGERLNAKSRELERERGARARERAIKALLCCQNRG